jgi:D-alanyl-D-alanine carboxypeptidase (penicillin-binding protein 5/6)
VRAPRAILTGAVVALAAGGGLTGCGDAGGDDAGGGTKGAAAAATPAAPLQIANGPITPGTGPRPLAVNLADPRDPVDPHFKRPPRAGLLFDLDTGRVLWRRNPTRALPIASLTKMMTALIVADRLPAGTKVRVTKEALAYHGSGVGVLPKGKSVGVSAMLYGLLLPSGNDAAIALAQRTSGTVARFVTRMNAEAASLGLQCSHFSSPSGFVDAGNSSCPLDLAALSRAILDQPRLAKIVGRRQAVLPFPIKGGKLFLNNNNPLLRTGYPGTIGIKTGYTDAAGRCLVAAVTRRGRRLGVVLLHSIDPGRQARVLFDRGLQEVAPR